MTITELPESGVPAAPEHPPRRGPRLHSRVVYALLAAITAGCAVLAGGALLGRWRFSPVVAKAPDVHVPANALLVLTPATFREIHPGDRIIVQLKGDRGGTLYRVRSIASTEDGTVQVYDRSGNALAVKLGFSTWRIRDEVPALGVMVAALPGSFVTWVLIGLGVVLLVYARFGRRRGAASSAEHSRRS